MPILYKFIDGIAFLLMGALFYLSIKNHADIFSKHYSSILYVGIFSAFTS